MSKYGRFILELVDNNISVDLHTLRVEAYRAGFNPRDAKIMCVFLGVRIHGGS